MPVDFARMAWLEMGSTVVLLILVIQTLVTQDLVVILIMNWACILVGPVLLDWLVTVKYVLQSIRHVRQIPVLIKWNAKLTMIHLAVELVHQE